MFIFSTIFEKFFRVVDTLQILSELYKFVKINRIVDIINVEKFYNSLEIPQNYRKYINLEKIHQIVETLQICRNPRNLLEISKSVEIHQSRIISTEL